MVHMAQASADRFDLVGCDGPRDSKEVLQCEVKLVLYEGNCGNCGGSLHLGHGEREGLG